VTATQGLQPGANQLEVESEILRLSARLENATDEYQRLITLEASAEVDYKKAKAQATLKSNEGTVQQREAQALLAVADEFVQYRISEALASSQKELLHSLRAQLSALQTLAANIRAQV
jgi:hypothetical protein